MGRVRHEVVDRVMNVGRENVLVVAYQNQKAPEDRELKCWVAEDLPSPTKHLSTLIFNHVL